MTQKSSTTPARLAVGLVALAVLAAPALVSTETAAAMLAPRAVAPRTVACLEGQGEAGSGRSLDDTPEVSTAVKERVEREIASTLAITSARSARTSAATLPAQIAVPVQIHVIHGRHRGDRNVSRTAARRLFYTLRAAFNGRQNSAMAPTGVVFELNKITVNRNDSWYHARPGSQADRQMKRTLHRGKRRVLNVYLNKTASAGQSLLGFARFPWLAGAYPKLDGVTVNVETLPGGRISGYNLGDTIVHEAGHWLGAFHTFEGGCESPGDYVTDTAAEAEPSFTCPTNRDTCPSELPADWMEGDPEPAPVFDPITNFMDYSFDSCMNNFTPGQRNRMVALFMRYRYGR